MEELKKTLEAIVDKRLNIDELSPTLAIDSIVEFFTEHKIELTGESNEEDMLLFQYGTYDWDGTGGYFEYNITRQLEGNEDEFVQIGLTLFYDPKQVGELEGFNLWSVNEPSFEEWLNKIKITRGSILVSKIPPIKFEVTLNET